MANKGKAVMTGGKDSSDKTRGGGIKKRKNRDVLQFFEDAAEEFDASDNSDWSDFFDDDDFLGEFNDDSKARSGPEKFDQAPFFPKEEELSGDELEKVLKERYGSGSGFVRYAEADYESKGSVDRSFLIPSIVEPIIWKVKCKVGREKNVVFCLIQKYVDLKVLGTKLQIISTFAVEHIKGFVFVEAEKQSDVTEACYQLADVYSTLVTQVPSNEVGQLLNVRKKSNEVKEGTWARVKNGIYRGDLTQVVAVNNERKRATVKLIPRVDMQALMEKYGGGSKLKRPKNGVPPTARLISSRELEEFRPLIQYRRDRDTGKVFEFLDGLMLKDGFVFKKVSIDSLAFWDVNPTEDELQKFIPPCQDESDNVEWLSQLYGEKKKGDAKIISKGYEKGGKGGKGGKGEGSSGSNEQSGFEVHDLVLFGKRDFGMVIGMEKDEKYKVLKEGSEGPVTMTFGQKELKYLPIEKKFTASDHRMKTVSINDAVRILDGPSKGKQGVVKQIYRGIIFVYDENDLENAYFCSKSKLSEKVKQSDSTCPGKDEGIPSSFEDVPSSPKSPLSPKKPWQMKDNSSDDRGDKGEIFSVGQSLRIKVGPLKGYLCRVLAVRYSEVVVKLDSKQKVLTVKHEHLSEVREKSSTSSMSQDPGLVSSFKPFDLLGADGAADDWLKGASGAANGDGWNVASSNERSTWGAVSSWGTSVQDGTTSTALPDSVNDDTVKEDDTWLTKVSSNQNSNTDTAWGKQSLASASTSWGKAKDTEGDNAAPWNISGSSSGQVSKETSSWDNKTTDKGNIGSWDNGNRVEDASGWKKLGSGDAGSSGWGTQKTCDVNSNLEKSTGDINAEDSWGKAAGGFKSTSVENKGWGSSSQSPACDNKEWGDGGKGKGGDDSKGWGKGSGSLTNSQKGNSVAGWGDGGGPKVGDNSDEAKTDGWKAKSFGDDSASGFTKLGETGSWGQPKSFENDQGFNGGRGSGGRRGRGGDQFGRGRGRGRSFDGGRFSSSNEDGQDNHSSGNHGWNKSDSGSSWGNSSAGDGLKSGWGKEKSWNGDVGGDCKVDHPEKNSSDSAWNSAPGSSSWGHNSLGKGKGVAAEGASWGKSSEARDEVSAMDIDGKQTSSLPENSWGKAEENKSTKNIGGSGGWTSTQVGQSVEGNAWSKGGGTSNSSSWGKGADDSVGGGNGSWQRSGNSESDQGFGSSRGRGRGFGRGRDFAGRGRGRSDGPGQGSSWKSEGQGGQASWGNSSGGNGGTSWTSSEPSGNKSWGSSGGWNQKEQENTPNEPSGNKSWDSGSGGPSWGKSQSGGGGGGSWGKS
ncbi:protein RNA-directed DNA methylation 3 isoform X2 [Silene latifolia]|uniref:protein RNA-directed DNA methylation 3 isoform X2 n=1 Tax=Silene latifolia TaxID=37657 RepID=UPI003D77EA28